MFRVQHAMYEFSRKRFLHYVPGWMRYSLLLLVLVAVAIVLGEQETLAQGAFGDAQGAPLDLVEELGSDDGGGSGTR